MQISPITKRPELANQNQREFQPGQVLLGKVGKIFPNQTAEVQIGSQQVIAVLDASLNVGERYWLQVQSGHGKMHFKALGAAETGSQSNTKGTAQQLLSHLSITKSKESGILAEYLLKNQLPVTKATFEPALQWLKTSSDISQGLAIIKTMHDQKLPFVKDVFTALSSVQSGKPMHSMLTTLLQQLNESGSASETVQQTKVTLQQFVLPKQEQFAATGLQKTVSLWLSPNRSADLQNGAYSLLQNSGLIPNNMAEQEFLQKLITTSSTNHTPALLQQGSSLISAYSTASDIGSESKQATILQLFNKLVNNHEHSRGAIPDQPKAVELMKLLLQTGNRLYADQTELKENPIITFMNSNSEQVASAKQQLSLQLEAGLSGQLNSKSTEQIVRAILYLLETEYEVVDFSKATAISSFIKETASKMGLGFEHALAGFGKGISQMSAENLTSLKPLLMKLLQDELPIPLKDTAEQAINRITAQQILTHENGPLQHMLLQLPIILGTYQTDLTLDWSGQRKKDGSIDPAHCRIVFYLQLESLKETIIDMTVQNRVIKITVFNEYAELVEQYSQPFVQLLKNNLDSIEYKLSGITFLDTAKNEEQEGIGSFGSSAHSSYNRLDIRI
jgi:hypothetical protein